ncbi:putative disease resistance RPP13-like protein 1 [Durio zibethinus]|uniref:Disease resistance RPP13-like protein 1 n=1 Tax=Durio zibethinus TaxID=66656 RepID=A0A6P5ZWH4_DURZI|nr:putative disease resistance RPP13-like protein 1 [Durio zibethinus]
MEVIVSTVADAVLSAFFRSVFETLSSPDFLKFTRDEQVVAEMKKWEKLLLKINALLEDAEEKQTTSRAVKLWLRDLQDVAFDAEDVVDELATEALRRKLMEQTQPSVSSNKVWKFILPSCFCGINSNSIKFDSKIKSKIEEITARLADLAAQKSYLNLVEIHRGRSEKVLERLPTSSLVDKSHVYGRERDKDAIINLLMDGGEMDVVPIVGMGGVGKTTLAQLVYDDERIETSFELRAWICVSEEFDVLRVTKTLLHAVASDIGKLEDLNLLQMRLKEKLLGRKFLIVLDDMWNENYEQWDVLCKPFAAGAAGSKILITTRNERVAAVVANHVGYHLKELSNDDCLSLFTWHALRANNFDGYPNLKVVGEQIVKRCKGLPLAVKTLGGLLRTKVNRDEWEEILMSKIWDLPEERSGIIPALRLSYHLLPSYLKRCFAYCAIFPKDYEFDKDLLVLLWMAEGFLQQPKGKRQMEDIGLDYFNELFSRSFFQQSNSNKTRFVMHDLINDLAQSVSEEICFSFEDRDMLKGDKLCTVVEKIRHLSFLRKQYDVGKRFEILCQMKNLRTLIALPTCMPPWAACCYLSGDVLQNKLPRLRCLRVLCLIGYCISELPNSIGQLKHLRYLNLSRCRIKQLPQSVGFLFNLQTLILQSCKELTKLPEVIKNLENLRVLDLTDTGNLQEMPFQIGNLKNLQTLTKFIVGEGIGSAVSELRGLLHLRGELSILGLENVSDIQDASNANLKDKHGLTALDLQWSPDRQNEEAEMHVLDMLLPHKNLEKLSILFYGGKKFPSWLGDPSLTNIMCLELCKCRKSISLPSLGRLPSLKMLTIIGMDSVQKVDVEFYGHGFPSVKPFPSLEILRFKDMLEWTCWSSPSQANEDSVEEFPCLHELVVEDCPKLSGKLPSRLPSLLKLVIKHCPKLEGSSMNFSSLDELNIEYCNVELLGSILGLTPLTSVTPRSMLKLQCLQNGVVQFPGALRVLVISNCNGLTSLWQKGAILLNIASLECLKIRGCSQFGSLAENEQGLSRSLEDLGSWKPPWGMHAFTSLVDLQIESCPNLVFFPKTSFVPMLKNLKLKDCRALKSLPSVMMMLNCPLEELEIEDCPALTSFPSGRITTTLRRLRIGYCEGLTSLPEGLMQIDKSTSSISHLENLEIIGCPSLISFPEGKLPTSLKILKIWNCSQLEPLSDKMLHKNASLEFISISKCKTMTSLPECLQSLTHLTELNLSECPALKYFPETGMHLPNLRKFDISDCISVRSLPEQMLSLTSLQFLTICDCPGLVSFPEGGLPPNLVVLVIWDCKNLKQPMSEWNLLTLSSLRELTIVGAPGIVSFPDEKCPLPTTLVSIYIARLPNLRSLSMGLYNLTLLEELEISECSKLQCLPMEGLPAKLGRLCIRDCQLLKQQCLKGKGAYWPVMAHIPYLEIEITDD